MRRMIEECWSALTRLVNQPKRVFSKRRRKKKVFRAGDAKSRFAEIYRSNYWGNSESVSGAGSTLEYTQNIRQKLPAILDELGVRSVFDAPCGDFHWMQNVIAQRDLDYLGADIVDELIKENKRKHQTPKLRFEALDIAEGPFPTMDLWICRDCFFHLPYRDILASLENFQRAEIKYLLTSTHIVGSGFRNTDLQAGGFRLINLFEAPFFFPRSPVARFDDFIAPFPPREMCLWTSSQVAASIPLIAKHLKA